MRCARIARAILLLNSMHCGVQLMRAACPGFKPPSRHKLSNKLLDQEHEEVEARTTAALRAARDAGHAVTLATDAWTSVTGESVVNFMAVAPSGSYCVHTEDTKDARHTGEHLAEVAEAVMDKHGPFDAVVTDNAANQKKARDILCAKRSHLIAYPCAAHGLQNLLRDVCDVPSVKGVLDSARKITTTVQRRQVLHAALKHQRATHRTRALAAPVATRWGTQYVCVARILENRTTLGVMAVTHHASFEDDMRALLQSGHIS